MLITCESVYLKFSTDWAISEGTGISLKALESDFPWEVDAKHLFW